MARQRGPWRITGSTELYRDAHMTVRKDAVIQPDGQPGRFVTATVPAGVAVLPIDRQGTVYLTRQFRYALGDESTEVVSGAIAAAETPLEAARREVHEELGIVAADWHNLGRMDLDTSSIAGPVRLYVAYKLTMERPEREGTETIRTVTCPFAEAMRMVLVSEITHGPSCVLILKARQLVESLVADLA